MPNVDVDPKPGSMVFSGFQDCCACDHGCSCAIYWVMVA